MALNFFIFNIDHMPTAQIHTSIFQLDISISSSKRNLNLNMFTTKHMILQSSPK